MLAEAAPAWSVSSNQVHLFDTASDAAIETYRANVREADLIITQPIWRDYRQVDFLATEWIRNNARHDAKVVVFPSIYFRGYATQSFALHTPGHLMDYHDVHIADMFLRRVPPSECLARIRSSNFFSRQFLHAELFLCYQEMLIRDLRSKTDIVVSDVIMDDFSSELLFFSFNHPARRVLATVLNRALQLFGSDIRCAPKGTEILNDIRISPYFSAAYHLGLSYGALAELELNIRPHAIDSLEDYVLAVYENYEHVIGRDRLASALSADTQASAYLDRHRQAAEMSSTEDRRGAVDRAFRNFLGRQPAPRESLYHVGIMEQSGMAGMIRGIVSSPEYNARSRSLAAL